MTNLPRRVSASILPLLALVSLSSGCSRARRDVSAPAAAEVAPAAAVAPAESSAPLQERPSDAAPPVEPVAKELRIAGSFPAPPEAMPTIYFEYDDEDIPSDQLDAAEKCARYLADHPEIRVMVVGHADERGTTEYNLALGERRARKILEFFLSRGVSADRLAWLSKGEEEPLDASASEAAYAVNRRAEYEILIVEEVEKGAP